jgi:hypothetical protein
MYSPINNLQTCSLCFVKGEFYLISFGHEYSCSDELHDATKETKLYEIKTVSFLANYISSTSYLFIS